MTPSPKSKFLAFILLCGLGTFGAHRFYVGKIGTGILYLLTIGGGFTIGLWIDIVKILMNKFTDKEGRVVSQWRLDEFFDGDKAKERSEQKTNQN